MKKFSSKWKASKRPGKQRKYRGNLPLHQRKKLVNANLSKELRAKYKKRSMSIKKGFTVKIMKGKFKKHEIPKWCKDNDKYMDSKTNNKPK